MRVLIIALAAVFIIQTAIIAQECIQKNYVFIKNGRNVIGSGTLLEEKDSRGENHQFVLTCDHVIRGKNVENMSVAKIKEEKEYTSPFMILFQNQNTDVALLLLLKTQDFETTKIGLTNKVPEIGLFVHGFFAPKGLPYTYAKGFISHQNRNIFYQVDITGYDGCSGGAIINKKNQIIGIVSRQAVDRMNGVRLQNIVFAVKNSVIYDDFKKNELLFLFESGRVPDQIVEKKCFEIALRALSQFYGFVQPLMDNKQ